jgi:hypothetical protein
VPFLLSQLLQAGGRERIDLDVNAGIGARRTAAAERFFLRRNHVDELIGNPCDLLDLGLREQGARPNRAGLPKPTGVTETRALERDE